MRYFLLGNLLAFIGFIKCQNLLILIYFIIIIINNFFKYLDCFNIIFVIINYRDYIKNFECIINCIWPIQAAKKVSNFRFKDFRNMNYTSFMHIMVNIIA